MFVHYKNEKDVEHLQKLNPKIKVEGRKVSMVRVQRDGSPRPHPVADKGKAPMKNSLPSRDIAEPFFQDSPKDSDGSIKFF